MNFTKKFISYCLCFCTLLLACKETHFRVISSFPYKVEIDAIKGSLKKNLKKDLYFTLKPSHVTTTTKFHFKVENISGNNVFLYEGDTVRFDKPIVLEGEGRGIRLKNHKIRYVPLEQGTSHFRVVFGDNKDVNNVVIKEYSHEVVLSEFSQKIVLKDLIAGIDNPIDWVVKSESISKVKSKVQIVSGDGIFMNDENKELKKDTYYSYSNFAGSSYFPIGTGKHKLKFTSLNFDKTVLSKTLELNINKFSFAVDIAPRVKVNRQVSFKIKTTDISLKDAKWIKFRALEGTFKISDNLKRAIPFDVEQYKVGNTYLFTGLTAGNYKFKVFVCSKNGDIAEKTINVIGIVDDFKLSSNGAAHSIYVKESKTIVLTMDNEPNSHTYTGKYTATHTILNGEKYIKITDRAGKPISNGQQISTETGSGNKQIYYNIHGVLADKQKVKVVFTITNDSGKKHKQTIEFTIQNKEFSFKAQSSGTPPYFNKVTGVPMKLVLDNTDLTYDVDATIDKKGYLKDAKGMKYRTGDRIKGIKQKETKLTYYGEVVGQHTLGFSALANNGKKQSANISFDFDSVGISKIQIQSPEIAGSDFYRLEKKKIGVTIEEKHKGQIQPNRYNVSYKFEAGYGKLYDDKNTLLTPNINYPLTKLDNGFVFEGTKVGQVGLTFTVKNDTGGSKSETYRFNVQRTDFTIAAALQSKPSVPINDVSDLSFTLTRQGVENLTYNVILDNGGKKGIFIYNGANYYNGAAINHLAGSTAGRTYNLQYKGQEGGQHKIKFIVTAENKVKKTSTDAITINYEVLELDNTITYDVYEDAAGTKVYNQNSLYLRKPLYFIFKYNTKKPKRKTELRYKMDGGYDLRYKGKDNNYRTSRQNEWQELDLDNANVFRFLPEYLPKNNPVSITFDLRNATGDTHKKTYIFKIEKTDFKAGATTFYTPSTKVYFANEKVLNEQPFISLDVLNYNKTYASDIKYDVVFSSNNDTQFTYKEDSKTYKAGDKIRLADLGVGRPHIFRVIGKKAGTHTITAKVTATNGVEKSITQTKDTKQPFSYDFYGIAYETYFDFDGTGYNVESFPKQFDLKIAQQQSINIQASYKDPTGNRASLYRERSKTNVAVSKTMQVYFALSGAGVVDIEVTEFKGGVNVVDQIVLNAGNRVSKSFAISMINSGGFSMWDTKNSAFSVKFSSKNVGDNTFLVHLESEGGIKKTFPIIFHVQKPETTIKAFSVVTSGSDYDDATMGTRGSAYHLFFKTNYKIPLKITFKRDVFLNVPDNRKFYFKINTLTGVEYYVNYKNKKYYDGDKIEFAFDSSLQIEKEISFNYVSEKEQSSAVLGATLYASYKGVDTREDSKDAVANVLSKDRSLVFEKQRITKIGGKSFFG